MQRHENLSVAAYQRVVKESSKRKSETIDESGAYAMLQPHQHFARYLFRLVGMREVSSVGDLQHRQIIDEIMQPIKVLADECMVL